MKEAKLSVSNNITNTTEAHERELSWETQAEGPQLEVAIFLSELSSLVSTF